MPVRAVLVFLLLAGCTRAADEGVPTEAEVAALPDQESWGAVLRIDEGAGPRLVLEAPYLARYDRPPDSLFTLLGPDPASRDSARAHVMLYDEAGGLAAAIRADRLVYYDQDRRFVAEGGVVVTTAGDRRLESERVAWDEAARQLRADGFFRFTSPAERVQGVGLVAAEDLSRFSFRQASGELEVEE